MRAGGQHRRVQLAHQQVGPGQRHVGVMPLGQVGVQGRAQLAHHGGRRQAVPLHVADDEGRSPARGGHDVVPVAADLRVGRPGQVADRDLQLFDHRQLPGQQGALQGRGHVAELGHAAAEVEPGGAFGLVQPGPFERLRQLSGGGREHLDLGVAQLPRRLPPQTEHPLPGPGGHQRQAGERPQRPDRGRLLGGEEGAHLLGGTGQQRLTGGVGRPRPGRGCPGRGRCTAAPRTRSARGARPRPAGRRPAVSRNTPARSASSRETMVSITASTASTVVSVRASRAVTSCSRASRAVVCSACRRASCSAASRRAFSMATAAWAATERTARSLRSSNTPGSGWPNRRAPMTSPVRATTDVAR